MYIERLVYPVLVLGHGERIGIWFQGCNHRCKGCINPELWVQKKKSYIDVEKIVKSIQVICKEKNVDGITLTGGDPIFQMDELLLMLNGIKGLNKEILLYTGFEYKEIKSMDRGIELLEYIDILIDGKYVQELNEDGLALRGSSNQKIHYRNKEIENKYKSYIQKGRQLQQVYCDGYMLSLGIHDRRKEYE